jgi:Domain of unknown function (DUF4386)
MNTMTLSPTHVPAAAACAPTSTARGLGLLLVADALLSFAPLVILGAAIGWPASLDKPAAEQLAAIGANADAVALGYGLYLLYSVLVAPLMIGLAARCFGGLHSPLAMTVAVFGALSALARAIGILRWLTVMPALATAHGVADAAARAQIELVFSAVNEYGGGIGEILGVSLFMALSLGTLSLAALARGGLPKWLAALGGVSAAMLAALALPALRIDVQMPVAAAVSMLSLWMLAAGVWLLRQARG